MRLQPVSYHRFDGTSNRTPRFRSLTLPNNIGRLETKRPSWLVGLGGLSKVVQYSVPITFSTLTIVGMIRELISLVFDWRRPQQEPNHFKAKNSMSPTTHQSQQ